MNNTTRNVWIGISIVLVVLLAGIFTAFLLIQSDTELQRSEAYIEIMRTEKSLNRFTDNNLISLAKTGCLGFDEGESFIRMVELLMVAEPSLIPKETGAILGAGTIAFCPEHREKLHG